MSLYIEYPKIDILINPDVYEETSPSLRLSGHACLQSLIQGRVTRLPGSLTSSLPLSGIPSGLWRIQDVFIGLLSHPEVAAGVHICIRMSRKVLDFLHTPELFVQRPKSACHNQIPECTVLVDTDFGAFGTRSAVNLI